MAARRSGASANPRAARPARAAGRGSLPFEIPFNLPDIAVGEAMDDFLEGDVADEDLEAELEALMGGRDIRAARSPVRVPPTQGSASSAAAKGQAPVAPPRKGGKAQAAGAPHPGLVPPVLMNLDLKAFDKIGEDDGDDDEDVDENDPELLAELADLSPDDASERPPDVPPRTAPSHHSDTSSGSDYPLVKELRDRLNNYETARQDAVDLQDTGKVRRYDRSIKTLKEQLGLARKGQAIPGDEIPPAVFVKPALQNSLPESKPSRLVENATPPTVAAAAAEAEAPHTYPPVAKSPVSKDPTTPKAQSTPGVIRTPFVIPPENSVVRTLHERRDEYRHAALEAKHADNKREAIRFMNIAKQFDVVIKAAESGEAVDLSAMPPHPSLLPAENDLPARPLPSPKTPAPTSSSSKPLPSPVRTVQKPADDEEIPDIDPSEVKAAFNAPDAPKTVLEALEQRLEKYKATASEAQTAGDSAKARRMQRIVKQYQDAVKDFKAKRPVDFEDLPTPPGFGPIPTGRPAAAASHAAPAHTAKPSIPHAAAGHSAAGAAAAKPHHPGSGRESRNEQQYQLLLERQKQFKLAALKAKKEGALETARHYLRQAKGLEPMIEASASGLPVEVTAIPKAPPGMASESDGFEVVQYEDAGTYAPPTALKDRTGVYTQLEKDLVEQVQMCMKNVDYFKKSGDIPMSEKFEKFNQHSRKDLESLRNAFKHGLPVPRFHYENRIFSVVKCCPELPENIIEFSVLRGFGFTLPDFAPYDFTTYVKWDFPFPPEAPQSGKTAWFKGTNEPEYCTMFTLQINRKSRSLPRILKTKGVTCEVVVRMGFMKADRVLGTVHMPLEVLETRCVHHTSIDLMGGKQAVGGKLEVKARVREPILRQQVEELKEKWLVIDQFMR